MTYSVTKLKDNNFDLYGIKLENNKTCCYWSNKGDLLNVREIFVIFDNKNVINVHDGEICISFSFIDDKEDAVNMINAFGRELYKDSINITKIKFNFIVDNKEQESIVSDVISMFRLSASIKKSDKYSDLTENLEDAINNISSSVNDSSLDLDINEDSNDTLDDEEAYDGNNLHRTLEISNVRENILSEWLNDPSKKEEISSLSREELGKRLIAASESAIKEDFSLDESLIENNELSRDNSNKVLGVSHDESDINKDNSNNSNVYKGSRDVKIYKGSRDSRNVDSNFWDDDNMLGNGVKVLKKTKPLVYEKKKKVAKLPILMFIISLLLIIASLIFLFLMK